MLRVLARFAGTPGAKWFLCHLELGVSPGQLYGRRIARVDQGGDSDDDYDDDDDYGDKDKDGEGTGGVFSWDSLLDQGKLAAMTLGEYTVLAGKQKFREMQAEYMDRTLSATVLKKTPKSLQAAVENMNDNKSLLPANFHSSVRVHMF